MERTCRGRGDEGQVDVGAAHAGKLDLCLLCGILESLEHHLVVSQVDAVLCLELVSHPVDDSLVEIVAAEVGIAVCCKDFKHAVGNFKYRDIERTAAEVEYHDSLVVFLIHAVSKRCRRRLVDDSHDLKSGDLACVLGCLTLCVGEVCGNRDDGLCDLCSEVSLCVRLQLLKDHRGDLLGGIALAVDIDPVIGAHMTLYRHNGSVGICDSLTLCNLTDDPLTGLGECDDGRCGSCTFGIGDDDGLAAFINCNARIGRAEIDTNDFFHNN